MARVTSSIQHALTPHALGDEHATFKVYIGNRPDYMFAHHAQPYCELRTGEIDACAKQCGNGWRKVFNVYAKLVYALAAPSLLSPLGNSRHQPSSWQSYRDDSLLQANSKTALCFVPPNLEALNALHLVMGKGYANTLDLPNDLAWLNHEFAISEQHSLIVCPYFDYRQLSNVKILFLVDLITRLQRP
ncbi:hypothetical protein [Glaciecola sp. XM2]|uniref:DUF6942 family protein n=1 Tax=Glaciecola sp. XM2 TaxID=1914931 RepID=UPI002032EE26|nr:hypothetical protein [Glaciecola sp. XM2]